jgi:threonine/homoserine/homoserine lactone efflux protein
VANKKADNIVFNIIVIICIIMIVYVGWNTFSPKEIDSGPYIEQFVNGKMIRACTDGTILEMS